MTKTEAKDILIDRLDFRVTDADPQSGKYFEGEHSIITLDNIKACQPESGISDEDFTTYLTTLKTDCIYNVLADVFDTDYLSDTLLARYPALFDNAISKQMAIIIANLIITSTRLNSVNSITEEAVKMIHFDIINDSGIANAYEREVRRVQNKVGGQRKFVSITTI